MKRFCHIVFLWLLMAFFVSCERDAMSSVDQASSTGRIFHASIEAFDEVGDQTKVFADSQMRVLWNADDRVSIFNKNAYNQPFQFNGADGANAGDFQRVNTGAEFITGNPLNYVYSVYPYSAETSISNDGIMTMMLPAVQSYKANSFGIGANAMVSVSNDNLLLFRNVGGYLSFKLYGEGAYVKSITLRGNNHEKIAGLAAVTMAVNGTPVVEMQNKATEEITLTCETSVALSENAEGYTEFWFVVPPTTFAKGITIVVTDAVGNIFEESTSNPVAISRNTICRMSPLEVAPTGPAVPKNGKNENIGYDKWE